MYNKLVEYFEKNVYLSIYSDETSKFIFGKIFCISDKYVIIQSIDPDGDFDGFILKCISDIIRLESDDRYSKKMEKLMSDKKIADCSVDFDDSDIIFSFLKFAQREKMVVSIEINYSGVSDIVGLVDNMNENICTVYQIDEYGFFDGLSAVSLDCITQIYCGSKDTERICKLYNYNKNKRQERQGTVLCLE